MQIHEISGLNESVESIANAYGTESKRLYGIFEVAYRRAGGGCRFERGD